jgi:hypothetical protein
MRERMSANKCRKNEGIGNHYFAASNETVNSYSNIRPNRIFIRHHNII